MAISVGGMVGSFEALRKHCAAYEKQKAVATQGDKSNPGKAQQPAAPMVGSDHATASSHNTQTTPKSGPYKPKWAHEFTCEMKAGEFFLAWLTALLVAATGGLIWAAVRQEEMAKTHERAYVFGMLSERTREPVMNGYDLAGWKTRIAVHNTGRTPAAIKAVHWTLVDIDHRGDYGTLGRTPVYKHRVPTYLALAPQETRDTKAFIEFSLPINKFGKALFTMIVYEDVFRRIHHARFLVRMSMGKVDGSDAPVSDPMEGFPEYYEWD